MSRLIFPSAQLPKRVAEERILLALYEIYKEHPVYTYNESMDDTKIAIFPSYGDDEAPGKKPKMVIKMGGYPLHFQDTLGMNYAGEVKLPDKKAGMEYIKKIETSATVLVHAYAEEQCSDIAEEFALLATFLAKQVFAAQGININVAQISETDCIDKDANIYQTGITLGFDFTWKIVKAKEPTVRVSVPELEVLPEEEREAFLGRYRHPGVTIFRKEK